MDQEAVNQLVERICYGAPQIWNGLDRISLEGRYLHQDRAVFRNLEPLWDLQRDSKGFEGLVDEAKAGTKLYVASRAVLMAHCEEPSMYDYPRCWDASVPSKLARVAGEWEAGIALTPPILRGFGPLLRKLDGHHRLTAALLSETSMVPFWAVLEEPIAGVVERIDLIGNTSWKA